MLLSRRAKGVHSIKKTIAIGVLVAFVWMGMASAAQAVDPAMVAAGFIEVHKGKGLIETRMMGGREVKVITLDSGENPPSKDTIAQLNLRGYLVADNAEHNGLYLQGQNIEWFSGKIVTSANGMAYGLDIASGIWMSDPTNKANTGFVLTYSRAAIHSIEGIPGTKMWRISLPGIMKYFSTKGWNAETAGAELEFVNTVFKNAFVDESGAIIQDIANVASFYTAQGRVGTFTVTGQIDPVTKKGYNWAQVPGGNTYAGLGGDMVDIKTLLTDAKYKDLALAILNNKALSVEKVVREEGSRLLQQGQLNGVIEEIRKFL